MEFIQGYVGRCADFLDIITNFLGFVVGYCGIIYLVRKYSLRVYMFLGFVDPAKSTDIVNVVAGIRFLYMVIFVVIALYPFDISVYGRDIYLKLFDSSYGARQIILDPLYHFRYGHGLGAVQLLELLAFVPIALFTSYINVRRGRLSLSGTILFCLVFAFFVECSQLFVMSKTSDVFTLVLSVCAVIAGWLLSRLILLKEIK
jgi:glycopeptide antibiotics resistance protein